jgi:hypothetical protein
VEGDSHYNIIRDIIHSVPSIQFNDRDSLPPNGQLLNSIHCHEQWSPGRFSLFNYYKTSRILRRYAPAAAARIRPLVAQKRCTSPLIDPMPLIIFFHLALKQTLSWIFLKQTFKMLHNAATNHFI